MITQFISPWIDGQRTTIQFFGHINQMWIIVSDNSGRVVSRGEHSLGDNYAGALEGAAKLGWDRHDVASA
jgi:hypothetical protein